jgi:branched-chain amino acid transport system permease protein
MEYFLQQLINGVTLGSIYGLIAIGYTMVYGIIGMINFAHGDIFMIGAFIALIVIVAIGITAYTPIGIMILALVVVIVIGMFFASVYNWTVERVAYRPLRGSFRLAPLISAIGMSITLQEYARISQDARPKPLQPIVSGGFTVTERLNEAGSFVVSLSYIQIIIVATMLILMTIFTLLITKTSLGRAQRACEQDRRMAALLGVDVNRLDECEQRAQFGVERRNDRDPLQALSRSSRRRILPTGVFGSSVRNSTTFGRL